MYVIFSKDDESVMHVLNSCFICVVNLNGYISEISKVAIKYLSDNLLQPIIQQIYPKCKQ